MKIYIKLLRILTKHGPRFLKWIRTLFNLGRKTATVVLPIVGTVAIFSMQSAVVASKIAIYLVTVVATASVIVYKLFKKHIVYFKPDENESNKKNKEKKEGKPF